MNSIEDAKIQNNGYKRDATGHSKVLAQGRIPHVKGLFPGVNNFHEPYKRIVSLGSVTKYICTQLGQNQLGHTAVNVFFLQMPMDCPWGKDENNCW